MGDPAASSVPASELPFLSPAEWSVFSLVSKRGPLTVRQLLSEFETTSEASRSYTTVVTLAQRVATKGYLSQSEKAAPSGPASAITFSSCIPYADALRRHAERFLDQYASVDPDDLRLVREAIDQRIG